MTFNLPSLIEHNRRVLLRLIAGLFAMAGIVPGGPAVAMLPFRVRAAILMVLRPAESALRRLAFAKAKGLAVPPRRARPAPSKPIPKGDGSGDAIPPFALFDRRKAFAELTPNKQRYAKGPGPAIWLFDGSDPIREPEAEPKADLPEGMAPATTLCGRLQAIEHALGNLDKQARRMARAMAKRAAAKPGPGRYGPLRPGLPPGYRQRHIHEIDEILAECDRLARREPAVVDTS